MTGKEQELRKERIKKLEGLRSQGIEAYPASTARQQRIAEVLELFKGGKGGKASKGFVIAGRVRAVRGHGAIVFGTLDDGSGTIQFILKQDSTPHTAFELFTKYIDIGDFIEVAGGLMVTRRGEKSILVHDLKILTKSLRALPDKWHGLKDEELRLRKRYLDLLSNPEVRELFRKKAIFWQTIRDFMIDRGFLEVWTPALENIPGGADAEPFITHHNALNRDFYLRISLELPLKRLLVGGLEKVFEVGRLFRNEGMDREHLQEYDDMEFYWAYADHEDGMKLVEELFKAVVKAVGDAAGLNWSKKWPRVDYFEAFKKESRLDLNSASDADLRAKAKALGIELDKKLGRGRVIDAIYKKAVRPKLMEPCFLVGHPVEISPLAKLAPGRQERALRFQVVAQGTELGNGFGELNDPIDQKQRFVEQMKLRAAGDREAQMMDEDFVEALEYGMPPAVGFGVSERLFAVLQNKPVRETVIFPPMREEKK